MAVHIRQKSNWLFAQIVAISTGLVLICTGLLFTISKFTLSAIGDASLQQIQATCGCQIPNSSEFSFFVGFIMLFGLAIALSLLTAFAKIIISLIKTKIFIDSRRINTVLPSAKLAQVTGNIGITKQVIEINEARPLVFCHGILKPKIYIASTVVQALSHAELQAVLLHETHHALSQEPARLLLLKFIGTFTFIPGIKNLTKKYLSFSEMAADELATDNFTKKSNLASAMAKILEMEETTIIQNGLAISYLSQITEERVMALSDKTYTPSFKKEVVRTFLGLAGTATIFFLFNISIKNQQSHAQNLFASSGCADKIYVKACSNAWGTCDNNTPHSQMITCKKPTVSASYIQP
jgi:beta-lactamase regulating signal transducer with metallopeptidase domain